MQEFKIGDWVQVKSNSDATLINSGRAVRFTGKVVGLHPRNGICVHPFDGNPIEGDWYLPEELTLWQPKEGEWCWFCSVNGNSELGQFIEEFFEGRYRYKLNGTNSIFNCDAVRCEPFICKLPTFLKDK